MLCHLRDFMFGNFCKIMTKFFIIDYRLFYGTTFFLFKKRNKKQENSSSLMVILNLNSSIKIHSTSFNRVDDYMTSLKLHIITIIINRQPHSNQNIYTCFKFNSKYKLENLTKNKQHTSKKIFHLKKQSN